MKRSIQPTQFSEQFPHLHAAILALGESDAERADMLGVCPATLSIWRHRNIPQQFLLLLKHPSLAIALAEDAQQQQEQEQEQRGTVEAGR